MSTHCKESKMHNAELQGQNLEHARWRVEFLRSLLQAHQALPSRKQFWKNQEATMLTHLFAAEQELHCLAAKITRADG
jgi:hypothetical protein